MRYKSLATILLSCSVSWGQLLSVTATLTDSDGTVWKNATCSVSLFSPNGTSYYNGTPVPTAPQACNVNASGVLTTSIYNTSTITPIGAQYQFSINSATSAIGSSFNIAVTTANMTSALSAAIKAPRFAAGPYSYGYADIEAAPSVPGSTYYNTVTPAFRQWTGSAWANVGGAGGGTTTCPTTTDLLAGNNVAGGCVDSGIVPSTVILNNANTQTITTTSGYVFKFISNLNLGSIIALYSSNSNQQWDMMAAGLTGFESIPASHFGLVDNINNVINMDCANITGVCKFQAVSPKIYTVATLPSASTMGAGAQVTVSDASTFNVGTCTGGGSDYMTAISNGTTWSCH